MALHASPLWTECRVLSDQYALWTAVGSGGFHRAAVTLADAEKSFSCARGRGCAVTMEQNGGACRLFGRADGFRDGEPLVFDLRLTGLSGRAETAVSARVGRRTIRLMRADGRAEVGENEYLFAPAHSLAVVEEISGADRGSRPNQRAVAAGRIGGAPGALLLGDQPEDSLLLIGGQAWPLGAVAWDPPEGPGCPWRFSGGDGKVELTFDPATANLRANRRFFRSSIEETQVFGRFSGSILLENGREIALRQMNGLVQKRSPLRS